MTIIIDIRPECHLDYNLLDSSCDTITTNFIAIIIVASYSLFNIEYQDKRGCDEEEEEGNHWH